MEVTRLNEGVLRRRHASAREELPDGFVPLRLLLQPGGFCVELNRPDMLLGRHSEADIRLVVSDVSRRHCRFVFADGVWQVIDLQSLNGVWVNEVRLEEAALCHGDHVRVGSLTFLVELGEQNSDMIKSIADVLPLPGQEQQRRAS